MDFLKKIVVAAVVVMGLGLVHVSAMNEQPEQPVQQPVQQPVTDQQFLKLLVDQQKLSSEQLDVIKKLVAENKADKGKDKQDKKQGFTDRVTSCLWSGAWGIGALVGMVGTSKFAYNVANCLLHYRADLAGMICPPGFADSLRVAAGTVILVGGTAYLTYKAYENGKKAMQ